MIFDGCAARVSEFNGFKIHQFYGADDSYVATETHEITYLAPQDGSISFAFV